MCNHVRQNSFVLCHGPMGRLEVAVYSAQGLVVDTEFGKFTRSLSENLLGFYDPVCTIICEGQTAGLPPARALSLRRKGVYLAH